jgi:hypothetical protein
MISARILPISCMVDAASAPVGSSGVVTVPLDRSYRLTKGVLAGDEADLRPLPVAKMGGLVFRVLHAELMDEGLIANGGTIAAMRVAMRRLHWILARRFRQLVGLMSSALICWCSGDIGCGSSGGFG